MSQAQRRFMYAQHPDIARRWEKHTPKGRKLPERVGDLRGLGADPTQAAGTGAVALFLVLGLGVGAWFLVSAASGRYTER